MEKEIKVSVLCLAYNHEKYIRKCLDGFVMQKTNFKFEVLINDDASTDNTAQIIREYEEKYPDIIKPIYQTENQHSKHVGILRNILLPKAKGKYIAFCEGDDYWCDENKLQLQYDVMEGNPDCKMCVHKVERVSEDGETFYNNTFVKRELQEGVLDNQDLAKHSFYDPFHLCSYFLDGLTLKQYYQDKKADAFRKVALGGDIPIMLNFINAGSIYFIDKIMSIYRCGAIGSWGSRNQNFIKRYKSVIATLKEFNRYSNYRFNNGCRFQIKLYRGIIIKTRILNFFRKFCPYVITFYYRLKGKFNGK